MTSDYDAIAAEYHQASKEHPIKQYVEAHTLLQVLGDLREKTVLDLACGEGYYTRLLKRKGAKAVVGVDLSQQMIDTARTVEAANPLGVDYQQHDVTTLGKIGNFDLVTAVYLFPYATTRQTLTAMAQAAYLNLQPGGRLVAIVTNPAVTQADFARYAPYGFQMRSAAELQDGSRIETLIRAAGVSFTLETYHWLKETYEAVLQDCGFQQLAWHSVQVSETGLAIYGAEHWQELLAKPFGIVLAGSR